MKKYFILLIFSTLIFTCYVNAYDLNLILGYGFGFLNIEKKPYYLTRTEDKYDFFHIAIAQDSNVYKNFYLSVEPFFLYQNRPKESINIGFTVSGKTYLKSFFISVGAGMGYTTYRFEEQGTRFPFILQGGIGYKWGKFFIENRFKHYSNGGLYKPNTSINSNLILFGIYL